MRLWKREGEVAAKARALTLGGKAGSALLLALVLTAVFAHRLAPGDPFDLSPDVFEPPSREHPFGTDDLGRDVFRAVVHGARVSMLVGLLTAGIAAFVGILVGGLAGYSGGTLDDALMRGADLVQVLPRFFLIVVAASLLGSSLGLVVLVLALTYWPGTARLMRAQVMSLRSREFVLAARAMGVEESRILTRHVLPLALPPVLTQASFYAGGAILAEAGLSFLGLGDPGVMSWGGLIGHAQEFVRRAWWMSLFPGVAITVSVLALNLLADALVTVDSDPTRTPRATFR